jgi:hypothetical protein
MEVQGAWAEREEVGGVAQVLGDDDPAAGAEHAAQLGEERQPRLVGAQLVRREQQQRRLDRAVGERQATEVDGLRRSAFARFASFGERKVRTPQGSAPGNARSG